MESFTRCRGYVQTACVWLQQFEAMLMLVGPFRNLLWLPVSSCQCAKTQGIGQHLQSGWSSEIFRKPVIVE